MTASAVIRSGTDWPGAAFLVIANTVAPEALAEYEDWHGREHVPERLTMPGFRGARRFVRGRGARSRFLTLYDLDTPAALETPEYRHLLANPTPASLRMRPLMSGFRRFVYRETGRSGAGGGSHLGFLRWRADEAGASADAALLSRLVGGDGIVALRLGRSRQTEPHPAFAPDPDLAISHGVAAVTGTDAAALKARLTAASGGLSGPVLEHDVYRLILAY
jgi:hypothetical protein